MEPNLEIRYGNVKIEVSKDKVYVTKKDDQSYMLSRVSIMKGGETSLYNGYITISKLITMLKISIGDIIFAV